ncbi:Putative chromosome partition protein smc [endosymbiont DhMRE of Dentiscutata heterogama]|uniref:hypothetical protein n=1 Tax=endosymbiont DhMRE of Dentiscutata heterogama TaxID=1609546 RepID=UPI000629D94B|nr:hypothetical protein [endosymbiont DhMRE of Dentiscutata heterogama]CFW92898.1 Putative chromosome partition protein smc [endosymbiont DhMRE of Dentiscutata heterogama]
MTAPKIVNHKKYRKVKEKKQKLETTSCEASQATNALINENADLKKRTAAQKEEIDQKAAEINRLTAENKKLQNRRKDSGYEEDEEETINRIIAEKAEKEAQIKELEKRPTVEQLAEAEKKMLDANEVNTELQNQIASLKKDYKQAQKSFDNKLKSQEESFEKQKGEITANLIKQTEETWRRERERERERERAKWKLEKENEVKKYKEGYDNLIAQIKSDFQLIEEEKKIIDEKEEEIETKAHDLFLREGEVNAIENALKNVLEIEVKGDFKEKLIAIQQELEKWKNHTCSVGENNEDIKEKLTARDKEIEKIRQEKAGLETKLTEKNAEITDLTEKITAKEAEFTQKSEELNEANAAKNDVERAHDEAKRKISTAEKECEAFKDELTREQSVHKSTRKALETWTATFFSRNAAQVSKDFQDAKAAKTQAESERNAYRESQNTIQQEKDKVLANLNKEQKQHQNTKDQLAIVSQAKEKVEKTLVAEKAAHAITAAAKNEVESKLNNKVDDLEKTDEQLRKEQKKVQALQAKCRKLRQVKSIQQEQENEILIRLNTDLHHQLETALKNYQQTKNDLQTEQTANQKLSQNLEKLQADVDNYLARIAELTQQKEELSSTKEQKERELNDLRTQNRELFNQKRQAETLKNNTLRNLADLQNENQQFRQTIDQKTAECDTTQQERDREIRKTSLLKKATKSLRDKLNQQTNNLTGLLSAANNAIRTYEKYLKEELKISDLNNLPSVPAPLATLINFFNNPPNCLNPQHSDYDSLKSRLLQAETECDRLATENQKLKNQNDPARNDNPQKRSGSQPTKNKSPADSQLVNELRNQIMTLNQKIRQGESINEKELLSRINSDLSLDLIPPINYDQVITAIQQLIKNKPTESYNQELASGSDKVNKNLIPWWFWLFLLILNATFLTCWLVKIRKKRKH